MSEQHGNILTQTPDLRALNLLAHDRTKVSDITKTGKQEQETRVALLPLPSIYAGRPTEKAIKHGGSRVYIFYPNGKNQRSLLERCQQLSTNFLLSCTHRSSLVMQWVPSHCDVEGNEHADRLAKAGSCLVGADG